MELTHKEKGLLALAEKYNWDANKISSEYGKSYANTCYKLYELQEKVDIKTFKPQETASEKKATKCTDKHIELSQKSVVTENDNLPVNLHDFIPPKPNFNYIEREVDDNIAFWSEITNKKGYTETIALIGEAGSGKNESIYHFAEKKSLPLLVIPCDDSQILNQLLGYWQAINGTTVWKEGLLCNFIKNPSVVIFDEVNCLPGARLFMLHELLENHKLFSKDAPKNQALTAVHKECYLFLAMNPPTVGYSGTNRLNIALGSRPVFIEVPSFNAEEMNIDTGDNTLNLALIKFYNETKRVIKQQNLRSNISIRNINRIAIALKGGASTKNALLHGFINSLLATASETEKNTITDIARTVFGADVIDEKTINVKNVWGYILGRR